jgi:deoxyribodipyrimidine photo-lyase
VWLVHPWSLGALPADLPEGSLLLGVYAADFHRAWPWSDKRWHFVDQRMKELTALRWWGDAQTISLALASARQVRSTSDPHLDCWLKDWAQCETKPALFPHVAVRCDSFSKWWTRAMLGVESATDLLASHAVSARQRPHPNPLPKREGVPAPSPFGRGLG